MNYAEFLAGKAQLAQSVGIAKPRKISEALFPFQRAIVEISLRRGKCAVFAGTGLGKTPMQCEWARHVEHEETMPVLIFAPLAVTKQTITEARKILGMEVRAASSQADVASRGVYITNYQKLHLFDAEAFGGVVLDESSIIKNEDGAFRNKLIDSFRRTRFKLACTATPAPNDFMEIGNHADFLDSMSMSEMLSTFFVHDGGSTQDWRLKGHAETDFWRWMASWAVCLQMPSDLGFDDAGYVLPKLHIHECIIESTERMDGELFAMPATTMSQRRGARKASVNDRVAKAAEIANGISEQVGVWCNLNAESLALTKAINGAVEVTGSDSDEHKETSMMDFAAGKIRAMVSKAGLCGFGMNWQNCHNTIFTGLSDSFEQYYQAVRRYYRFGQKEEVHVYIVIADTEGNVLLNIQRKQAEAEKMQKMLVEHMAELTKKEIKGAALSRTSYIPSKGIKVPDWLTANVNNSIS